jgi:ADP-heptose:LPS heptosyltransferase
VALVRHSLPSAHLTYLVGPWSAAAARHGPAVDEIRSLPFPGFTRHQKRNLLAPYAVLGREAARLRPARYDLAIVLRGDHWWGALLALLAGIPLRVGGASPEAAPLLTHTYAAGPDEPWGEQALGIARLGLGVLGVAWVEAGRGVRQFALGESARGAAAALWQQHHLADNVVALHPGAGAPLKSWPAARWAQLADALLERGLQVALVGAPDDASLLDAVSARMRKCATRLCGQELDVSAAVYERCRLVVTVDSGAGHLAAAVGARTLRFYGPAAASVFGPWPEQRGQRVLANQRLACAPCGYLDAPPCGARVTPACMLALGVDDVLNAIRAELPQG